MFNLGHRARFWRAATVPLAAGAVMMAAALPVHAQTPLNAAASPSAIAWTGFVYDPVLGVLLNSASGPAAALMNPAYGSIALSSTAPGVIPTLQVQMAGQYCTDKTMGQVWVPSDSPVPDGLSCSGM
jgi:hypothetical protein